MVTGGARYCGASRPDERNDIRGPRPPSGLAPAGYAANISFQQPDLPRYHRPWLGGVTSSEQLAFEGRVDENKNKIAAACLPRRIVVRRSAAGPGRRRQRH